MVWGSRCGGGGEIGEGRRGERTRVGMRRSRVGEGGMVWRDSDGEKRREGQGCGVAWGCGEWREVGGERGGVMGSRLGRRGGEKRRVVEGGGVRKPATRYGWVRRG